MRVSRQLIGQPRTCFLLSIFLLPKTSCLEQEAFPINARPGSNCKTCKDPGNLWGLYESHLFWGGLGCAIIERLVLGEVRSELLAPTPQMHCVRNTELLKLAIGLIKLFYHALTVVAKRASLVRLVKNQLGTNSGFQSELLSRE
jgi:hypothetical protein